MIPDSDKTNNKSHEALVREMGGNIEPRGPHQHLSQSVMMLASNKEPDFHLTRDEKSPEAET